MSGRKMQQKEEDMMFLVEVSERLCLWVCQVK